ncbi:MAG TPA: hypothetical protein VMD91_14775 [Candidatus Sulfotelmatobacter sp.]|nr:hypothetical protein [Candidatus Sulfotelmatobacter sp.]
MPGPQYVSIGITAVPQVRDEHDPLAAIGASEPSAWQAGESRLFGRYAVASVTEYRWYLDPPGPAAIHRFEVQAGGGVGIAPHLYVGGATFARPQQGDPPIHGLGYGLLFMPNPNAAVAPYGWGYAYPNVGGNALLPDGLHTALTYRGTSYRIGVLLRRPGNRAALDLSWSRTALFNRTNAPTPYQESALAIGLNYRLGR